MKTANPAERIDIEGRGADARCAQELVDEARGRVEQPHISHRRDEAGHGELGGQQREERRLPGEIRAAEQPGERQRETHHHRDAPGAEQEGLPAHVKELWVGEQLAVIPKGKLRDVAAGADAAENVAGERNSDHQ